MVSGTYDTVVDVDNAATNSLLIEDLAPGTWFFVVTAVDQSDNESAMSAEVSKVITP